VSGLSKRLKLDNWVGAIDTQAPGQLSQENLFPPHAPEKAKTTHSHGVQFYSDEEDLMSGLTCFIEAAIKVGSPAIAVATESHRDGLLQRLLARGVDAAAAMEQGLYIPLDVHAALSTFMVNDLPDPVLFTKIFGDLFSSVTKVQAGKPSRVAACGEFAPTLWAQGKRDAAIQVEHLTDEIAKTRSVDILCGYVLRSYPPEQVSQMHGRICAEHSAIHSR
jgi:MEDS: MEthanogen/methylotroph, DcmR Sensory domain